MCNARAQSTDAYQTNRARLEPNALATTSSRTLVVIGQLPDGTCNSFTRRGFSVVHRENEDADVITAEVRDQRGGCTIVANPAIGPAAVQRMTESITGSASAIILVGRPDIVSIRACLAAQSVRPTPCFLGDAGLMHWLSSDVLRGRADVRGLLLHAWHQSVGALPPLFRVVLCSEFAGARVSTCSAKFVSACARRRRTVERSFAHAHLPGVARTLTAIRLAYACGIMTRGRLSAARAAQIAGFGSTRSFSRICALWLGIPPRSSRQFPADVLAARIIAHAETRNLH